MDDLDVFGVGPTVPQSDPMVEFFFRDRRDDGWERVLFTKPQCCGCCGREWIVGWLEMESDAIRCGRCVPPERIE